MKYCALTSLAVILLSFSAHAKVFRHLSISHSKCPKLGNAAKNKPNGSVDMSKQKNQKPMSFLPPKGRTGKNTFPLYDSSEHLQSVLTCAAEAPTTLKSFTKRKLFIINDQAWIDSTLFVRF